MGKGSKIAVFIIVAFVIALIGMAIKEASGGAAMTFAAVAIFILYQAMFKKRKEESKSEDNDITLKK